MRGQLGHPSFTAYLARVARALGATRFCWATERRGWAHDDNEHRFADADEMTHHVNRLCRDFAKEHMDAGDALEPLTDIPTTVQGGLAWGNRFRPCRYARGSCDERF
jgi:hypothetical protein